MYQLELVPAPAEVDAEIGNQDLIPEVLVIFFLATHTKFFGKYHA